MSSTIIMGYAFKSGSSFSGVLGCPGLDQVGVLRSDDGKCPDVWSPKGVCLRSCLLETLGVSANSVPKVTRCWRRPKVLVTQGGVF
uniref:ASL1/AK133349 fusion protein n=1 Tax=Mus musculus TaxID=10090 RepID=C6EQJ1_MOUSE|nr:ASL1/AK133349 fusion protein [Mus musculus]